MARGLDAFDKLLDHAANRILLHETANCWHAAGPAVREII
jgi:hypothetical protein